MTVFLSKLTRNQNLCRYNV